MKSRMYTAYFPSQDDEMLMFMHVWKPSFKFSASETMFAKLRTDASVSVEDVPTEHCRISYIIGCANLPRGSAGASYLSVDIYAI
jgi:hypothetical protein